MNNKTLNQIFRLFTGNFRTTVLTLLGLTIGIASSVVILTKVRYEKSFDNFHSGFDKIYRVVRFTSGLQYLNGALEYRAGIHFPIPDEIKKTIPEATAVTSLYYMQGAKISVPANGPQKPIFFKLKEGVVFADPQYFEVFDYDNHPIKWYSGNKQEALKDVFSVVITREIEQLLFAGQSAMGQIISSGDKQYTVKGVIDNFPVNSDFPFKVMISMSTFTESIYKGVNSDWGSISDNFQCFVKLRDDANIELVNSKLIKILKDNLPKEEVSIRSMALQPLQEIHRDDKFGNFNHHTFSNMILNALTIIALFILVIAGLNFSSVQIAQSVKYNKETSIRRIMGCTKFDIFKRFLSQAFTLTFIASILGMIITYIFLKYQENLVVVPHEFYMQVGFKPLFIFVLIILSLCFVASIFPSLFFTSKPALTALKQTDKGLLGNKNNVNKATIILQFTVVSVLLVSTLVIYKQLSFINNKNLGYNPHGIISAFIPDNSPAKISTLKARLTACPDVAGVSFCSGNPTEAHNWTNISMNFRGKKVEFDSEIKSADSSYFNLNGFELIAGRFFSGLETEIIVNREFVAEFGIKNPEELLGVQMNNASVTGIVNNSHSGSLHQKLRPCAFINNKNGFREIEIKLNPVIQKSERSQQLKEITSIWKDIFPGEDYEFSYLTDQIDNFYKAENNLFNLLILFTGITTLLCCLGIYGLSVFISEQRLKEIGVRKVNGAQTSQVIIMLNNSYLKWIIIAFIISCPIAYYIMQKWLENFAYKTELSWWVFAASGVIALLIALFTVSWQSWRAASRNPVEALRYE